jgi:hypothetical protein
MVKSEKFDGTSEGLNEAVACAGRPETASVVVFGNPELLGATANSRVKFAELPATTTAESVLLSR